MTQNLEEVKEQARKAAAELLEAANLAAGSILVTGCSSSEITGGRIGKASWRRPRRSSGASTPCWRSGASTWRPSAASI